MDLVINYIHFKSNLILEKLVFEKNLVITV